MQAIDVVHKYGGDVIKFAGDAMIIAFYPDSDELATEDQGYHRAVLRCAHCALEVRLPK
jgi:class 3 adenylate cyclase